MKNTNEGVAAYGSPQEPARQGRLGYLPVSLFGSVMGLVGLSGAWNLAVHLWGAPGWVSTAIGLLAVAAFVAVAVGYIVKASTHFATVRAEYEHPVAGNLFGTVFISLLLLPIPLSGYSLPLARGLWVLGTIGMLVFAWQIMSRWLSQRQQTAHATPAWIVPVVGLIDIPLATPVLQWDWTGPIAFFALVVGLFFALPLFTLIFSRLLFEEPLAPGMQPSLMILLAPFAVGFSAYVTTLARIDLFASALYMLTLFLLGVLLGRLKNLARSCPFRLSWWSVSFPLAAAAGCAIRYAGQVDNLFTQSVAMLLLALATIVILGMTAQTLLAVARGDLHRLAG
ncbi:MAG: SLAC1 anion channel family protein [Comamonadaceae bacterium]|nr:SLAC1 anion channel family protein [Comamonadaceae bacterium]